MNKKILIVGLIGASTLVSLIGCSSDGNNTQKTELSSNGYSALNSSVFAIGGENNGKEYVNQSTIHMLGGNDLEKSIVMLPGHGLSSYLYTSTPDNRNGWNVDFVKGGYNTYAIDTNNLAISGMNVEDFNNGQVDLKVYDESSIWKTWGFGAAKDEPYEDTQYPVEQIDQLYASFSPMELKKQETSNKESESTEENTTSTKKNTKPTSGDTQSASPKAAGGNAQAASPKAAGENAQASSPKAAGGNTQATSKTTKSFDAQEVENMIALLEKTGPSVLMAHSMGATSAIEVCRQRPELVEALVLIEPVGSPTDIEDLEENFKDIPYLAVYGDYIESRNQTGRYESCQETAKILTDLGTKAEVITLTDLDMVGNTHLMMQDKNSSDIAKIIMDWLDENALKK